MMKSFILFLCLGLVVAAYAFPSGESDESDDVSAPPPPPQPDDDDDDYNDIDETIATDPEEEEYRAPYEELNDDLESNNTSSEVDAPGPEEPVLEFGDLKNLVYEFSNFSKSGFDTQELLRRVTSLEGHIQRTSQKLSRDLEQQQNQVRQLGYLLLQIREIKSKLQTFDNTLNSLTAGVQYLGENRQFPSSFDSSSGGNHRSWATLYRSRGHSGRSYELNFRSCSVFEDCCQNLSDLDNDSQSIHTHDTCVEMFDERDCRGDSRQFYPGSSTNHQDFGSYNDRFSSGKPCNRT